MKIQKGIVKYKDRNDIVCTYGVTDDGRQYYFLDETDSKKLANGNRIATTALVEAIDPMVKASNVGVIDNDGNVIVMFDNRSIKPISDEIILVEKAEPVSESVIEANNLRSDPLSATKLVSTPATIKDRLNAQMGGEGRYIFNDQFSEATLCDINGNNLVNGELYSFIAMTSDKIYLSKNTADSVINELVIGTPIDVQESVNDAQTIDVGSTVVDQSVVENALTGNNVVQEGLVAPENVVAEEVLASTEGAVAGEVVEEVMPYNDDISTVFDENNAPTAGVNDSTGFDLPETLIPYDDGISTIVEEPVQGEEVPALGEEVQPAEEVMPYDDGISTIADETAQSVEVPALGEEAQPAEEVMPYDDGISTIVEEPAQGEEVPALGEEAQPAEEVMPYDDGISTIVEVPAQGEEVPALGEEAQPAEEVMPYNDEVSTITEEPTQDSEKITDSTGFELPTDLIANDQLNSGMSDEEVVMPPVVEEEEVVEVPENNVEEVASDVVIPEVSADEVAMAVNENNFTEPVTDKITADEVSVPVAEEEKIIDVFSENNNGESVLEEDVSVDKQAETEAVAFSSNLYNSEDNTSLEDNFSYQDTTPVYGDANTNNYRGMDASYDDGYYDRKPIETYGSEKYSLPVRDNSQYSRYDGYDSVFKSSMIKPDRITPAIDYYDSFAVDYKKNSDNGSIMNDVARSMTELMRQNKEQKSVIIQFQEKLEAVESQRRMLTEKYNDQSLRVDSLSNKLRSLDDVTTRLESKNQMLESRIRDQEKIIAAQERELNTLRPQLEGRQDLIKILADAKALLGNEDDYQEESYYGRRVA